MNSENKIDESKPPKPLKCKLWRVTLNDTSKYRPMTKGRALSFARGLVGRREPYTKIVIESVRVTVNDYQTARNRGYL